MKGFEFRANFRRAIDGDTIEVELDLGFSVRAVHRLRIRGVNTPELRKGTEPERLAARKAHSFVSQVLVPYRKNYRLKVTTFKTRSGKERKTFGRYVAEVRFPAEPDNGVMDADYLDLGEELVKAKLANVI